jgi:hypothetical protein
MAYIYMYIYICIYICVCVCVCVCERERERERVKLPGRVDVNSNTSNLSCQIAPVVSTLVSRRLVFLIRFATRESRNKKNRQLMVLATNFRKQDSGKVNNNAIGRNARTYTANHAAAGSPSSTILKH